MRRAFGLCCRKCMDDIFVETMIWAMRVNDRRGSIHHWGIGRSASITLNIGSYNGNVCWRDNWCKWKGILYYKWKGLEIYPDHLVRESSSETSWTASLTRPWFHFMLKANQNVLLFRHSIYFFHIFCTEGKIENVSVFLHPFHRRCLGDHNELFLEAPFNHYLRRAFGVYCGQCLDDLVVETISSMKWFVRCNKNSWFCKIVYYLWTIHHWGDLHLIHNG